jgi:hypothetical protein
MADLLPSFEYSPEKMALVIDALNEEVSEINKMLDRLLSEQSPPQPPDIATKIIPEIPTPDSLKEWAKQWSTIHEASKEMLQNSRQLIGFRSRLLLPTQIAGYDAVIAIIWMGEKGRADPIYIDRKIYILGGVLRITNPTEKLKPQIAAQHNATFFERDVIEVAAGETFNYEVVHRVLLVTTVSPKPIINKK